VPELVNDQREDAAEAADDRHGRQSPRPGDAAQTHEDQREDRDWNERTARDDYRDWQLREHETSVRRYLGLGDSKHRNCIDTSPRFLEIPAWFRTVTGL
jgi:hypothetical protein